MVKVGGKLLQDVRFLDDQGMVADTESGLKKGSPVFAKRRLGNRS